MRCFELIPINKLVDLVRLLIFVLAVNPFKEAIRIHIGGQQLSRGIVTQ